MLAMNREGLVEKLTKQSEISLVSFRIAAQQANCWLP